VPHAADQGEAEIAVPTEDHAPGEGGAVAATEAEPVERGEDALAADEGFFAVGELTHELLVDGALARGSEEGVLGTLARVGTTAGHQCETPAAASG
jgi:hypothetical protein